MSWFGRNIISAQVIKARSDKLTKNVLRDAKRKIKSEELIDSYSFELYLQTIDAAFSQLKNDISSATQTADYTRIRSERIAETRQLLDFFNHDNAELGRLYQIVLKKAKEAGRVDDLKQEKLSAVDTTKIKESFYKLVKKDEDK